MHIGIINKGYKGQKEIQCRIDTHLSLCTAKSIDNYVKECTLVQYTRDVYVGDKQ